MPDFTHEHFFAPERVCGVDEAGCGPWAGPVVAAAVLFASPETIPPGLNDSKKLSAAKRDALYTALTQCGASIGVDIATAAEIDQLNIWGATALAMKRAVSQLHPMPDIALVDGKRTPRDFPCAVKTIIGGDAISLSIAAASIIAKVTRDRIMAEYAREFPQYGFDRHAGYGTQAHQAALAAHGPCPIHRRSFAPIRTLLERAA